jgi:hypothetical protein
MELEESKREQEELEGYNLVDKRALDLAKEWDRENYSIYAEFFCLKPRKSAKTKEKTYIEAMQSLSKAILHKHPNKLKPIISVKDKEEMDRLQKEEVGLCVLPKNHRGNCKTNIIPPKNHFTILGWCDTTPGADDVIYKNRAKRRFPIRLSDSREKDLRNKKKKRKCAIPLKEAATSFMSATAQIDLFSQILFIKGIDSNETISKLSLSFKKVYKVFFHKIIHNFYIKRKQRLLNLHGYLITPVSGNIIELGDLILDRKDNKSIQLGHCIPRSDKEYMTRGLNVCLMTRRDNLILGDRSLFDENWIIEINDITKHQKENQLQHRAWKRAKL